MDNYIKKHYGREGIAPCVGSIEAYIEASTPSKHNTILGCRDESFLKEIYAIEKNKEWRKMCVMRISYKTFLENVARTDPSTRVRKQSSRTLCSDELFFWMK